jgi:hypothetical protein
MPGFEGLVFTGFSGFRKTGPRYSADADAVIDPFILGIRKETAKQHGFCALIVPFLCFYEQSPFAMSMRLP